jgi:MHS family proline/betaine transporter-like MFS transporter
MLTGMLLGILLYRPIFQQLYNISDTSAKTVASNSSTSQVLNGATNITTVNKYDDGTELKTVSIQKKDNSISAKKEVMLSEASKWKMILLIALMVLFVTMVYGPIAAFLVELFPTRIRYTSMSLPYHIGNGVFGGLVPFIATLITTIPGTDHLSGLWYTIGVASLSFIIGILYLSNKIDKNVTD